MELTVSIDLLEVELEADLILRVAIKLREKGYDLIVIKEMKRIGNDISVLVDVVT